jgi:peptidoglycan/xylan/chitin deacetylase (PgdA/CDA1 family)
MIRLAFRLDDPSETSNQLIEAGVINVLRRHRATATFAVIPYRMVDGEQIELSAARAKPLVEAALDGVIEIALHGHTHQCISPAPAPPTEFAGRPENEQCQMIAAGRTHLENIFGRRATGFVPPWNSYDEATLSALEELGFEYLSACPIQHALPNRVKSLPLSTRLTDLPEALAEAQRFRHARPVIVVVLHHYDFAESGAKDAITDLAGFERALAMIREQKNVQILSMSELAATLGIRPAQLKRRQHWLRYNTLRPWLPKRCYLDAPLWRGLFSRFIHG